MHIYFINSFLLNSDILHLYLVQVVTSLSPSCTLYFLLFIFLPTLESSLYMKIYSIHISSSKFLQHERRIKIPGNYLISSFCAWIQHLVLSLFELYSVLMGSLLRFVQVPLDAILCFCCDNSTAQSHVIRNLLTLPWISLCHG